MITPRLEHGAEDLGSPRERRGGVVNGLYTDGAWVRPASSADSESVSFFAGFEKYVCEAASIPYAWLP